MKFILFCFLIIFTSSANATQIYTWVDENGEKHYSQTPPTNQPNQKYTEKNIKSSTPSATPSTKHDKDNNILRRGEVGPADILIKKKNPDKLYLVATPNINILIKRAEKRKGRKLTAKEIQNIRDKATAKAVTQSELKEYQ